jgi:hypothetical protein
MWNAPTLALGAILAIALPALSAEPVRIEDPDKLSEQVVETISKGRLREVAEMVADTVGRSGSSDTLLKFLQIFEGRSFDFTKKVIDKDYNGALRQIVYYSYVPGVGFVYFRFNFKLTSVGWILADFSLKGETNELFPKDFAER